MRRLNVQLLTLSILFGCSADGVDVATTTRGILSTHPMRTVIQYDIGATDEAGDQFANAVATGDINNDGFTDLVIGGAYEDYGHTENGFFAVSYGGVGGVGSGGRQWFSQDVFGENPASRDHFGYALAVGDFNDDGADDVAVGAPDDDRQGHSDAGVVVVFYGSPARLRSWSTAVIDQTNIVTGTNESGDRFGAALAAGDFNGDGIDDLAIGVPGEDTFGKTDAGFVAIKFGSPFGVQNSSSEAISLNAIPNTAPHNGDRFGHTLTVGNFDGDNFDDLAVAAPYADYGSVPNTGLVSVLYGSFAGLSPVVGSDTFYQPGFESPERYDYMGWSMTAGDYNDDGADDLAIGAPWEDRNASNEGVVSVVYGSSSGVQLSGALSIRARETLAESNDNFGYGLTTGDFDGDDFDDLGIGIPYEDSKGARNNGAVSVLFGRAGQGFARREWRDQASFNGLENHDQFGMHLATGDFNGEGADELVVGVPREDYGNRSNSGAVFITGIEPALPLLRSAKSAIVMTQTSGRVLGAKQPDVRRQMASTTKIMTALIVIERIASGALNPNRIVTISQNAGTMGDAGSGSRAGGSVMGDITGGDQDESVGLSPGDTVSVRDLLYGMLLDSGNDAAIALAEAVSGSEAAFVGLMNTRASQLGLTNTRYVNSHGRDPQTVDPNNCPNVDFSDPSCGHYSSARDVVRLTRFALTRPLFATVVGTQIRTATTWSAQSNPNVGRIDNNNNMIRTGNANEYPGAFGVKTGTTQLAGQCLVSAAGATSVGSGNLIAVVLGAERETNDRYLDSAAILDYGFQVLEDEGSSGNPWGVPYEPPGGGVILP